MVSKNKNRAAAAPSPVSAAPPAQGRIERLSNRVICACLFFFSLTLFLINIQFPAKQDFDEFHYVPSAKQFLAMTENQNWEHPPLGKLMMAVGIGLLGDRPIGWRFMSTLFGSATLVGMYLWGLAVFRRKDTALWVALITLFNQLLYVQARIGMLDTFMFAFMVGGFASFCAAWMPDMDPKRSYRLHMMAGLFFGFATACKWSSVVPWFLCLGLILFVKLLHHWGVAFTRPSGWNQSEDWYSPSLFRGVGLPHLALFYGLLPFLAYMSTFIPFLFVHREPAYTLMDLFRMQPRMYDGQLRVVTPHPYMSQWTTWPFIGRPMWYAFDKEGDAQQYVRGVILLGNPLIMWSGLLAWVACIWAWLARRSREGFLVGIIYAALIFSWAAIPRKVSFYYYYYPAGMTLSLALAFLFERWTPRRLWPRWSFAAASLAVFVYFFPILAALRIPAEMFRRWMWFSSWI